MSNDRYVRVLLTVIAGALVYLCAVLTPWPTLQAQRALRPGDPTGPIGVVIVGWQAPPSDRVSIVANASLPVAVTSTVQVTGKVTTERSSGEADRVVLVGWEQAAEVRPGFGGFRSLIPRSATNNPLGLPVSVQVK